MEDSFLLPHSEYSDCKDAGIQGKEIPKELTEKYAENEAALLALAEAHKSGKTSMRKSGWRKRNYAKKMGKESGT